VRYAIGRPPESLNARPQVRVRFPAITLDGDAGDLLETKTIGSEPTMGDHDVRSAGFLAPIGAQYL